MAILEIEHHWIDALARRRRGKNTSPVRVLVCDQCGIEGLLPKQLHSTLHAYDVPWKGRPITKYLCEIHMMLKKGRPQTPEFRGVVPRA